jgi:hypothetical protein
MRLPLLALIAAAAPLTEGNIPAARAGQWEETVVENGKPPAVNTYCDDGAAMKAGGFSLGPTCPKPTVTREGAGWAIRSSCKLGALDVVAEIKVAGDFQRAFHNETTVTSTQAGKPAETYRRAATLRYLGPCPTPPATP